MNWFHLITVIFIIAKIVGYTNWSWWLVFLPSIVSVAVGLAILLGLALSVLIVGK